jgi:isoleucyl-tRNA synthetase
VYQAVNPRVSFPKLEEEVLAFWQKHDIFKKSVEQREGGEEYVFYDGPPFATGLPHFGHFVPSTIKDIIPRYQTMKGKRVERRFGWDCHGLPVENLIEKELGLNSKTDIEKYGIVKFNDACRVSVLRYVKEWREIITRLGRWVDFDNDYKTMEPDYMESIWWVMKSLWEQGLLYEGYYILPYCPRCATVLSNHELNLGGYKDVHDPAITLRFKIKGIGENSRGAAGTALSDLLSGPDTPAYLLAWTTTPWTLPSNLALTVGPDIDYVIIRDGDFRYIMAEARLGAYYKTADDYTILLKVKGADLAGLEYEPLFPYFAGEAEHNAFRVYCGDFVSTEDGTGIVHTAPGFGEDDNRVLKGTGVPTICPIDAECKFTAEISDYQGRFVKDCDKDIIERLKTEGKLVKRDQILHAYPHCWRCGSPLVYRAVSSWFVDIQKIKQDMLKANEQIDWAPEHIKAGRFGKWLTGARDWAISRNRYWGNPLPIWKCPDCGKTICVGSRAELKKLSGSDLRDLHKQFVDTVSIKCADIPPGTPGVRFSGDAEATEDRNKHACGGIMKRIPEVLDCWFESGAMPYAQNHYPFENKTFFENHFPADFITEGLDQTRGWFYTLTILAAALFKRPAFKHCIVTGLVLAEDGKKMSKSQRNYTDPMKVVNEFGADALRLFLVHSAVIKAEDLRYSDEGVREVLKSIIIPLWNAYSFFVSYSNIDGITPSAPPDKPENPLDKWILSLTQTLIKKVDTALSSYDLARAVDTIIEFIDLLNNWYIRRGRRRFWRSENDKDKHEAYAALHTALKTLICVAAPIMPFTTDAMWRNLTGAEQKEGGEVPLHGSGDPGTPISVHLSDFPVPDESRIDPQLEFQMDIVRRCVSLGRALRSTHNIKVRQPLRLVELVTRDKDQMAALVGMSDIIREELNVKEVIFRDNEEELVEYQAQPNFRVLGKELGKDMKEASAKIKTLSRADIEKILSGLPLSLEIAGRCFELNAEKLEIRRIEKSGLKILNEGNLTVALDTEITADLTREGDVRDLVRSIQNIRKEIGLEVSDRVKLYLYGPAALEEAYKQFASYIAGETLAVNILWGEVQGQTSVEAGERHWLVKVEKA